MYTYDRTAAGTLPVPTKMAPVEFEYHHPTAGKVRIAWGGTKWFAMTPDHKIHPLKVTAGPSEATNHPNFARILQDQTNEVLGM